MGANLSRASKQENISTTLSSGITDVAGTMDVAAATQLNYPSYLVIDRVDSAGTLKSTSLWEYVKVTNIVGNTLTITRAQGGSTGQSHSSGAVVEAVMTAALQEEYYNAFNPEHTATGGHVISTATIAYLENSRMAVTSVCSIVYSELRNVAISSIASIAQANIKNIALTSLASIAISEFNIGNSGGHIALTPGTNKLIKMTVLNQENTTNAYRNNSVILTGNGVMTQTTASGLVENVTFGVTFASEPVVLTNTYGGNYSNATTPPSVNSGFSTVIGADNIAVGGFRVVMNSRDGTNFTNGLYAHYSWTAIGQLN